MDLRTHLLLLDVSIISVPASMLAYMFMLAACLKPRDFRLATEGVTHNSTSVTWNVPNCPNPSLYLTGFRVTATNMTANSVFDHQVDSKTTSIAVRPLNPSTVYSIVVVGINCYGETEPAELTVETLEEGDVVTVGIYLLPKRVYILIIKDFQENLCIKLKER